MNVTQSQTIYVTGGTGFIGTVTVPLLAKLFKNVVVLTRSVETFVTKFGKLENVSHSQFDLLNQGSCALEFECGSVLLHLGWLHLDNFREPNHIHECLPASISLIERFLLSKPCTISVIGTCMEYGLAYGPIAPLTATAPCNHYALAKDTLHSYLKIRQAQIPFNLKWGRLFYPYGSGDTRNTILQQLEECIKNGCEYFQMSEGEQLRDFIAVEKAADIIVSNFTLQKSCVYNIGTGKPISVRRLVENYAIERGSKIELKLGAYPYPENESFAFWAKL